MKFAGLFRRFYAQIIDALILLPLSLLSFWTMASARGAAPAVFALTTLLAHGYHIWFHARSGQTIGKRIANIRVVSVSGERISWREASLRSSVDVLVGIPQLIAMLMALSLLTDAELSAGLIERSTLLTERAPDWGRYVRYVANAWYWSEFVVMLFNAKRRALHDFIAGTVVVHEPVAALEPEGSALGPA
jgi:uncharacterized RDD family membrane protein YckC